MLRPVTYFVLFIIILFLIFCIHARSVLQFAWLSDIHIWDTYTGEDDLKAAVKDINSIGNINFVFVTGDITDLNIGDNLLKAKNALDELTVPYYIIPGNHDTKWTDSANSNFFDLCRARQVLYSSEQKMD